MEDSDNKSGDVVGADSLNFTSGVPLLVDDSENNNLEDDLNEFLSFGATKEAAVVVDHRKVEENKEDNSDIISIDGASSSFVSVASRSSTTSSRLSRQSKNRNNAKWRRGSRNNNDNGTSASGILSNYGGSHSGRVSSIEIHTAAADNFLSSFPSNNNNNNNNGDLEVQQEKIQNDDDEEVDFFSSREKKGKKSPQDFWWMKERYMHSISFNPTMPSLLPIETKQQQKKQLEEENFGVEKGTKSKNDKNEKSHSTTRGVINPDASLYALNTIQETENGTDEDDITREEEEEEGFFVGDDSKKAILDSQQEMPIVDTTTVDIDSDDDVASRVSLLLGKTTEGNDDNDDADSRSAITESSSHSHLRRGRNNKEIFPMEQKNDLYHSTTTIIRDQIHNTAVQIVLDESFFIHNSSLILERRTKKSSSNNRSFDENGTSESPLFDYSSLKTTFSSNITTEENVTAEKTNEIIVSTAVDDDDEEVPDDRIDILTTFQEELKKNELDSTKEGDLSSSQKKKKKSSVANKTDIYDFSKYMQICLSAYVTAFHSFPYWFNLPPLGADLIKEEEKRGEGGNVKQNNNSTTENDSLLLTGVQDDSDSIVEKQEGESSTILPTASTTEAEALQEKEEEYPFIPLELAISLWTEVLIPYLSSSTTSTSSTKNNTYIREKAQDTAWRIAMAFFNLREGGTVTNNTNGGIESYDNIPKLFHVRYTGGNSGDLGGSIEQYNDPSSILQNNQEHGVNNNDNNEKTTNSHLHQTSGNRNIKNTYNTANSAVDGVTTASAAAFDFYHEIGLADDQRNKKQQEQRQQDSSSSHAISSETENNNNNTDNATTTPVVQHHKIEDMEIQIYSPQVLLHAWKFHPIIDRRNMISSSSNSILESQIIDVEGEQQLDLELSTKHWILCLTQILNNLIDDDDDDDEKNNVSKERGGEDENRNKSKQSVNQKSLGYLYAIRYLPTFLHFYSSWLNLQDYNINNKSKANKSSEIIMEHLNKMLFPIFPSKTECKKIISLLTPPKAKTNNKTETTLLKSLPLSSLPSLSDLLSRRSFIQARIRAFGIMEGTCVHLEDLRDFFLSNSISKDNASSIHNMLSDCVQRQIRQNQYELLVVKREERKKKREGNDESLIQIAAKAASSSSDVLPPTSTSQQEEKTSQSSALITRMNLINNHQDDIVVREKEEIERQKEGVLQMAWALDGGKAHHALGVSIGQHFSSSSNEDLELEMYPLALSYYKEALKWVSLKDDLGRISDKLGDAIIPPQMRLEPPLPPPPLPLMEEYEDISEELYRQYQEEYDYQYDIFQNQTLAYQEAVKKQKEFLRNQAIYEIEMYIADSSICLAYANDSLSDDYSNNKNNTKEIITKGDTIERRKYDPEISLQKYKTAFEIYYRHLSSSSYAVDNVDGSGEGDERSKIENKRLCNTLHNMGISYYNMPKNEDDFRYQKNQHEALRCYQDCLMLSIQGKLHVSSVDLSLQKEKERNMKEVSYTKNHTIFSSNEMYAPSFEEWWHGQDHNVLSVQNALRRLQELLDQNYLSHDSHVNEEEMLEVSFTFECLANVYIKINDLESAIASLHQSKNILMALDKRRDKNGGSLEDISFRIFSIITDICDHSLTLLFEQRKLSQKECFGYYSEQEEQHYESEVISLINGLSSLLPQCMEIYENNTSVGENIPSWKLGRMRNLYCLACLSYFSTSGESFSNSKDHLLEAIAIFKDMDTSSLSTAKSGSDGEELKEMATKSDDTYAKCISLLKLTWMQLGQYDKSLEYARIKLQLCQDRMRKVQEKNNNETQKRELLEIDIVIADTLTFVAHLRYLQSSQSPEKAQKSIDKYKAALSIYKSLISTLEKEIARKKAEEKEAQKLIEETKLIIRNKYDYEKPQVEHEKKPTLEEVCLRKLQHKISVAFSGMASVYFHRMKRRKNAYQCLKESTQAMKEKTQKNNLEYGKTLHMIGVIILQNLQDKSKHNNEQNSEEIDVKDETKQELKERESALNYFEQAIVQKEDCMKKLVNRSSFPSSEISHKKQHSNDSRRQRYQAQFSKSHDYPWILEDQIFSIVTKEQLDISLMDSLQCCYELLNFDHSDHPDEHAMREGTPISPYNEDEMLLLLMNDGTVSTTANSLISSSIITTKQHENQEQRDEGIFVTSEKKKSSEVTAKTVKTGISALLQRAKMNIISASRTSSTKVKADEGKNNKSVTKGKSGDEVYFSTTTSSDPISMKDADDGDDNEGIDDENEKAIRKTKPYQKNAKLFSLYTKSEIYHRIGIIEFKQRHDFSQAIFFFNKALANSPSEKQKGSLLHEKGSVLLRLQNFYAALECFTEALDCFSSVAKQSNKKLSSCEEEIADTCHNLGRLSTYLSEILASKQNNSSAPSKVEKGKDEDDSKKNEEENQENKSPSSIDDTSHHKKNAFLFFEKALQTRRKLASLSNQSVANKVKLGQTLYELGALYVEDYDTESNIHDPYGLSAERNSENNNDAKKRKNKKTIQLGMQYLKEALAILNTFRNHNGDKQQVNFTSIESNRIHQTEARPRTTPDLRKGLFSAELGFDLRDFSKNLDSESNNNSKYGIYTDIENDLAKTLHYLGIALYKSKDYDAAKPIFLQELELRQRHELTVRDTTKVYQKHEEIQELKQIAKSQNCLGNVYFAQGNTGGAKLLFKKAHEKVQRLLLISRVSTTGSNAKSTDNSKSIFLVSPATCEMNLQIVLNLANVFYEESNFSKASMYLNEALSFGYSSLQGWDEGALEPARITYHLALCHGNLSAQMEDGTMENKALESYLKCLSIFRQYYGQDHVDVIDILNNVGVIFINQKRYGEAHKCLTRALASSQRTLGEFHEKTADLNEKMAFVLSVLHTSQKEDSSDEQNSVINKKVEDLNLALDYYYEAARILEYRLGNMQQQRDNSAHLRNRLEHCLVEIVSITKEVLSTVEKYDSILSRDLVNCHQMKEEISEALNRLGNLYAANRNFHQAKKCFEEVSEIHMTLLLSLLKNITNNQDVDNLLKDLDAAKIVQISGENSSGYSISIANDFHNLGSVHYELHENEEALRYFNKSLEITRIHSNSSTSTEFDFARMNEIADTLFCIGNIKCRQHRFAELLSDNEGLPEEEKEPAVDNNYTEEDNFGALKYLKEALRLKRKHYDAIKEIGNDSGLFMSSIDNSNDMNNKEVMQIQQKQIKSIASILYVIGNVYYKLGNFTSSIKHLEETLKITTSFTGNLQSSQATSEQNDIQIANILQSLGNSYYQKSENDSALKFFQKALMLREKIALSSDSTRKYSADTLTIASLMYSIGVIHDANNDTQKAYSLFQQVLNVYTCHQKIGPRHLKTAQVLLSLGGMYLENNNMSSFFSSSNRTIVSNTDVSSIHSSKLALLSVSNNNLDATLLNLAMKYFQETLRILTYNRKRDKNTGKGGMEDEYDEMIAETLHNMGVIYDRKNEVNKAMDYYQESLRMYSSSHEHQRNENEKAFAKPLHNMGVIHFRKQEYHQAKKTLLKALHIRKRYLGSKTMKEDTNHTIHHNHIDVAETQFVLGNLFCELFESYEDYQNDEDYDNQQLVQQDMQGKLTKGSYLDKAIQYYQTSVRIWVQKDGKESLQVSKILYGLGVAHFKKAEFDLALTCLMECLRIRRKVAKTSEIYKSKEKETKDMEKRQFHLKDSMESGADMQEISVPTVLEMDIADTQFYIGQILHEKGNLVEAESHFRGSMQVMSSMISHLSNEYDVYDQHSATRSSQNMFGDHQQNKYNLLREKVGDGMFCLGILLCEKNDFIQALELYNEAHSIFKQQLQQYHQQQQNLQKKQHDVEPSSHQAMLKQKQKQNIILLMVKVANTLENIGIAHHELRSTKNAIQFLEEAYKLKKKMSKNPGSHKYQRKKEIQRTSNMNKYSSEIKDDIHVIVHFLGNAYRQDGQYDRSIKMLNEALHIIHSQQKEVEEESPHDVQQQQFEISQILNDLGKSYLKKEEFGEAIDHFNKAQVLCKQIGVYVTGWDMADILHAKAHLHLEQQEFDSALTSFQEATKMVENLISSQTEKQDSSSLAYHTNLLQQCYEDTIRLLRLIFGEDHVETSDLFLMLGNIHAKKLEIEMASDCYAEAIRILRVHLPDDHLSIANVYHNIGNILMDAGDILKAKEFYEKALTISKAKLGENNLDVADTLSCLGVIYKDMSEYSQSLRFIKDALLIQKTILGNDNIKVANTQYNLCTVLHLMGENDIGTTDNHRINSRLTVLELTQETLLLKRSLLGMDSLSVAQNIELLGDIHQRKGEYDVALTCYEEVLRVRMLNLGSKHIHVADTLIKIGTIQDLAVDISEGNGHSETNFKHALDIYESYIYSESGTENPMITRSEKQSLPLKDALKKFEDKNKKVNPTVLAQKVSNLSIIYTKLGLLENAVICLELSLKLYQFKFMNADNLTTASVSFQLGCVYSRMRATTSLAEQNVEGQQGEKKNHYNNYELALQHLNDALQVRKMRLVPSHEDVEETLHQLGTLHTQMGLDDKAFMYFEEAMKAKRARARKKGYENFDTKSIFRTGLLHQEKSNFTEALQCFEEVLDAQKVLLLDNNSDIEECDSKEIANTLRHIANNYREIGEHEKALSQFTSALKIELKHGRDSLSVASTLIGMGIVHCEQNSFDLAMKFYKEALRIRKSTLGLNHIHTAQTRNNIGIVYFERGDYDLAIKCFEKALGVLKAQLGMHHEEVAYTFRCMGNAFREKFEYDDSIRCFLESLEIERIKFGKDSIKTAAIMNDLGEVFEKKGDMERALAYFQGTLQLKRIHLGNQNRSVSETIHKVAKLEAICDLTDDAILHYNDALSLMLDLFSIDEYKSDESFRRKLLLCFDETIELMKSSLGINDIRVATILLKKGNILAGLRENEQALQSFYIALGIQKKLLGKDDLAIANTLHNIGNILSDNGSMDGSYDVPNAIKCYNKALKITDQVLGDESAEYGDTLHSLGNAYKTQKDYVHAIQSFEGALKVRKLRYGEDHILVASTLFGLGSVYEKSGSISKASEFYKECLMIRREKLGPDQLSVASILFNLGKIFEQKNEHVKALNCYEDALVIQRRRLDDNDIQVADTLLCLGAVHDTLKDDEKAMICYGAALRIYKTGVKDGVENDQHITLSIATTVYNIGGVLDGREENEEAKKCYEDALETKRSILGENHTDIADILCSLGTIYDKEGDQVKSLEYYNKALDIYRDVAPNKADLNVAKALHLKGIIHSKQDDNDSAMECFNESLQSRVSILGQSHEQTADTIFCMGNIFNLWRDYDKAFSCFDAAQIVYKKKYGLSNLAVSNSLYYMGTIYEMKDDDKEKAVKCYSDSLIGRRKNLGDNHIDVGNVLNRLGNIHKFMGDDERAILCFEECLRIQKITDGSDDLDVAQTLLKLGTVFDHNERFRNAFECYEEALKIFESQEDNRKSMNVARTLCNLAGIYVEFHNDEKGIQCYSRALRIYKDLLFPDGMKGVTSEDMKKEFNDQHKEFADALYHLGYIHMRKENFDQALQNYREALKLYKAMFGNEDLYVAKAMYVVALVRAKQQIYDKAILFFEESLRIRVLHNGNDDVEVAETLFGIALVHEKKREYLEALVNLEECLRIRKIKFGKSSIEVAEVLNNIGIIRGNVHEYDKARANWEEALRIFRKTEGISEDDEKILMIKKNLAILKQITNR